jgi:YspA, cpYpsA-related SLOG family
MKVAIVGSRYFNDYKLLKRFVLQCVPLDQIEYVATGDATGADTLAIVFAKGNHIPFDSLKAEWSKYGNAAGPIRNQKVVDKVDCVIAFWDGKSPGTKSTIKFAERAKKTYWICDIGEKK